MTGEGLGKSISFISPALQGLLSPLSRSSQVPLRLSLVSQIELGCSQVSGLGHGPRQRAPVTPRGGGVGTQSEGTEALQLTAMGLAGAWMGGHRPAARPRGEHAPFPLPGALGQLFLAPDTWVFCSRRMSGLESLSGNPTCGCCKQPHAAVASPSWEPAPPLLLFEMNQTGSRRNHGSGSSSSLGVGKRPSWLLAPSPGPLLHPTASPPSQRPVGR